MALLDCQRKLSNKSSQKAIPDFMFKCRAPDCDSYYDLTYFWKAGFYDFPAFGGGNKTTLETSLGFFSVGKSQPIQVLMFPQKSFGKD